MGAQKCVNEEPFGRGKVAWSPYHHRAPGSQRLELVSGQETWAYSRKSLGFQAGERNHPSVGQRAEAGCSLGSVEAGLGGDVVKKTTESLWGGWWG